MLICSRPEAADDVISSSDVKKIEDYFLLNSEIAVSISSCHREKVFFVTAAARAEVVAIILITSLKVA